MLKSIEAMLKSLTLKCCEHEACRAAAGFLAETECEDLALRFGSFGLGCRDQDCGDLTARHARYSSSQSSFRACPDTWKPLIAKHAKLVLKSPRFSGCPTKTTLHQIGLRPRRLELGFALELFAQMIQEISSVRIFRTWNETRSTTCSSHGSQYLILVETFFAELFPKEHELMRACTRLRTLSSSSSTLTNLVWVSTQHIHTSASATSARWPYRSPQP